MNKNRIVLVAAGILVIALFGLAGWFFKGKSRPVQNGLDSLQIQSYLDMLSDEKASDSVDYDISDTEHIKLVDESVIPYLVPELCGYNPRNLKMGVITVRRDIDSTVYAKAFPRFSFRPGQVDSIADMFLYIKPMDIFPNGEYGRLAYVLANDSVIQIQFVRGGVEEMVSNVSSRLDAVSIQLQELARQMQDNKKKE